MSGVNVALLMLHVMFASLKIHPQTIYWGGMAQGKVRYFDPATRRAGLPADVAALVSQVGTDGVTVTLVNLSGHAEREVIIGAGSFGEHRFTSVERDPSGDESETVSVNDTYLDVELRPGTEIELRLGIRYFCQQPSYAFPWHAESVPMR